MIDGALTIDLIKQIKKNATEMIKQVFPTDAKQIILYGSCARGDFSADSDIDIAVITEAGYEDMDGYMEATSKIATELAVQYLQVVNIICIPDREFNTKKNWYRFYQNIAKEGEILYGAGI